MNIFWLDENMHRSAEAHVDRHVVKMVVESTQLLSNGVWSTGKPGPYRLTHKNHPCSIWVSESVDNWELLKDFVKVLGSEYTYRYGKLHKSAIVASGMNTPMLPKKGLTPPPLVMPNEYRIGGLVESYRNFYRLGKSHLHTWKLRNKPEWI